VWLVIPTPNHKFSMVKTYLLVVFRIFFLEWVSCIVAHETGFEYERYCELQHIIFSVRPVHGRHSGSGELARKTESISLSSPTF
jgi:hypothetical protein